MKSKIIAAALIFLVHFTTAQHKLWTLGTAKTLQKRQFNIGVFQPMRYGIAPRFEIGAHPLAIFAFPHLRAKKNWIETESGWYVATRHGINYPTLPLKLSQKQDFEEIIPDTTYVPNMLGFTNELLISTWLKKETNCEPPNYLLTLKLGVKNAYKFKDTVFPVINYPIIYHQASIYRDSILYYAGLDLDAHLNEKMNFSVDVDFLSVNVFDEWAIEHKAMLIIPFAKRAYFIGGYKLSYGTYPDKNKFFIGPLVEILWSFGIKGKREEGVFDKNGRL